MTSSVLRPWKMLAGLALLALPLAVGCTDGSITSGGNGPTSGGTTQTVSSCTGDADTPGTCTFWNCSTVPDQFSKKVHCTAPNPGGVKPGSPYPCPGTNGGPTCPGNTAGGSGPWSCMATETQLDCTRSDGGPSGGPTSGNPPPGGTTSAMCQGSPGNGAVYSYRVTSGAGTGRAGPVPGYRGSGLSAGPGGSCMTSTCGPSPCSADKVAVNLPPLVTGANGKAQTVCVAPPPPCVAGSPTYVPPPVDLNTSDLSAPADQGHWRCDTRADFTIQYGAAAGFQTVCTDGPPMTCQPGQTLFFTVDQTWECRPSSQCDGADYDPHDYMGIHYCVPC